MHASVQCEDRSRQAGLGDALADLEQDGRLPGVELGEAVVLASGFGAAESALLDKPRTHNFSVSPSSLAAASSARNLYSRVVSKPLSRATKPSIALRAATVSCVVSERRGDPTHRLAQMAEPGFEEVVLDRVLGQGALHALLDDLVVERDRLVVLAQIGGGDVGSFSPASRGCAVRVSGEAVSTRRTPSCRPTRTTRRPAATLQTSAQAPSRPAAGSGRCPLRGISDVRAGRAHFADPLLARNVLA